MGEKNDKYGILTFALTMGQNKPSKNFLPSRFSVAAILRYLPYKAKARFWGNNTKEVPLEVRIWISNTNNFFSIAKLWEKYDHFVIVKLYSERKNKK